MDGFWLVDLDCTRYEITLPYAVLFAPLVKCRDAPFLSFLLLGRVYE